MELHELLKQVEDESTFMVFVQALLDDWRRDESSWQNGTIEKFLDGALAWAQSTDLGASQDLGNATPWKRVATFLYCGKIYE